MSREYPPKNFAILIGQHQWFRRCRTGGTVRHLVLGHQKTSKPPGFPRRLRLNLIPAAAYFATGGGAQRAGGTSGEAPAPRHAPYRAPKNAEASGFSPKASTKFNSGGGLFCRAVTRRVSSALEGLTTVFGMGTGGAPPHLATGNFMAIFKAKSPKRGPQPYHNGTPDPP